MANKLNSGDILSYQVGNNVMVVDPNFVVDPASGKARERLVEPEDLVMYANLTAKISPRSKVIVGEGNESEVDVEIFKGTLNFLKPEGKSSMDSDWTEAFTDPEVNQQVVSEDKNTGNISRRIENQTDFQGFGITSIDVKINASYRPTVTINFTDVRGQTLFQQAKTNTPYTAFFHLPYPLFFLTLKGYYGKAVKFQLMLESFVSRFDPSSGDYLITCQFIGNHVALLRDINMHQAMTAPYMFPNRVDATSGEVTSTKGRQITEEVFNIYRKKKLIAQDFPTYTILELVNVIKEIDDDMSLVFGETNMASTTDKLEYKETLKGFKNAIFGKNGWLDTYLDKGEKKNIRIQIDDPNSTSGRTVDTLVYPLKGVTTANKAVTDGTNPNATKELTEKAKIALDVIVDKYTKLLSKNPTFNPLAQLPEDNPGKYAVKTLFLKEGYDLYSKLKIQGTVKTKTLTVKLKEEFAPWFCFEGSYESGRFSPVWRETDRRFEQNAEIMAKDMSAVLNTALEDKLGFKPTIRNVFSIILGGADTFLRLLNTVHLDAMAVSNNEKRINAAKSSNDVSPNTGIKVEQPKTLGEVFPWPQYYISKQTENGETKYELTYPGAKEVEEITGANDKNVWPEVDFVEEYAKTANYKYTKFQAPVGDRGITKNLTPIDVKDWPPTTTPYSSLDDTDLWFEILDRAQEFINLGSVKTRYTAPDSNINSTNVQPALDEIAKLDANNLYESIKISTSAKNVFKDLGTGVTGVTTDRGFEAITDILQEADPDRYNIYSNFGVVTPDSGKPSNIIYTPQPYTVKAGDFQESYKVLKLSKFDSFFDLVPNLLGNWNQFNYAGVLNVTDFYSITKNLEYDIQYTGLLTEKEDTKYYTQFVYANEEDARKYSFDALIERMSNKDKLSNQSLVNEFYEDASKTPVLTEGIIIPTAETASAQGLIYVGDTVNVRMTSLLNTPYFINSILQGVDYERNLPNNQNQYTSAAYLFLNSLPLPTFREKALSTSDESFGDYVSQLFNQMPALHKVPIALLLRIGSVWWRYKTNITTSIDPLASIWNDLGNVTTIPGAGGPNYVYDEVTLLLTTQYNFNMGGSPYLYQAQQSLGVDNFIQVGVYPKVIDAINYITTNSNNYTNIGVGQVLNNILPSVPLDIEENAILSFTSDDNTKVKFYDVYANSANIGPNLGVTFEDDAPPSRYYILYPSSGGLRRTDASTYNPTNVFNNTTPLHNGGCRFIWRISNYGYFENRAPYLPQPHEYLKKVLPSQDQQHAWNLSETSDYSTIQELRGVFNKKELDLFEDMFLQFSSLEPEITFNSGTMKNIIKELCIIEDTWLNETNFDAVTSRTPNKLANAQFLKFFKLVQNFLSQEVRYEHTSTTGLNEINNGSTATQLLMALHKQNKNVSTPVVDSYDFGAYANSTTLVPIAPASFTFPLPIEAQDMILEVGQYYNESNSVQFNTLTTLNNLNPIYNFFETARGPNGEGIEFSRENIIGFAPILRLYAAQCVKAVTPPSASEFIDTLVSKLEMLEGNQETYVNTLVKKVQKNIEQNKKQDNQTQEPITDERTKVKAEPLKLELYRSFKTMNDRWIAALSIENGMTLFEKFLFFDTANRDIGDEAIINIWNILKLDSPFDTGNSKTLTQSIDGYISGILKDNYFNYIALPSYINFFNIENDVTQRQGNALFGTFKEVDTLQSGPAFLCQYVGNSSQQLDSKTENNGFFDDALNIRSETNNPLIASEIPNKERANKVVAFNVDFGLKNQNIFESVTLDQSQYQNTSESYRILQEMADSGGGAGTSMASLSLFNVYASRSYTATITCMGNVSIQPTQYFQLNYLPMFNGPYFIVNVSHSIRPNNIETTFEGVRQPLAELPNIENLVQRVETNLYKAAETRLKQLPQDLYADNLSATPAQMKKTPTSNKYVDLTSTIDSPFINEDGVTFHNVIGSGVDVDFYLMDYDPEKTHLGIDIIPKETSYEKSISKNGISIFPILHGTVTHALDGCNNLQTSDGCGEYGNVVESKLIITNTPDEDKTSYYIVRYAFLRNINYSIDDPIKKADCGPKGKKIGTMGNSGLSKEIHLHIELLRGVMKNGKVVEHYLNPAAFIPSINSEVNN